jgi:hypothetical protein
LKAEGRDIPETELRIIFDDTLTFTWQLVGDARELARNEGEAEVLAALTKLGEADADAVGRYLGKGRSTVQPKLKRLVERNVITERVVKGGRVLYRRLMLVRDGADDDEAPEIADTSDAFDTSDTPTARQPDTLAMDATPGADSGGGDEDTVAVRQRVLALLVETFGDAGAPKGQWAQICADAGLPELQIWRAIRELEEQNEVWRDGETPDAPYLAGPRPEQQAPSPADGPARSPGTLQPPDAAADAPDETPPAPE